MIWSHEISIRVSRKVLLFKRYRFPVKYSCQMFVNNIDTLYVTSIFMVIFIVNCSQMVIFRRAYWRLICKRRHRYLIYVHFMPTHKSICSTQYPIRAPVETIVIFNITWNEDFFLRKSAWRPLEGYSGPSSVPVLRLTSWPNNQPTSLVKIMRK